MKAHYDSIHGRIESEWRRTADRFELETEIPANTTANVYLPTASVESVTEGGKPLSKVTGVTVLRQEHGSVVLSIVAGEYDFVCALPASSK